MTQEYIEFKQKVEKQRKVIARKQALLGKECNILADILKECPHEELEVKSHYYEGGYLNTAYTERWNQCKLCGAMSPKSTENHGTYA
jgi:hypothetical protein